MLFPLVISHKYSLDVTRCFLNSIESHLLSFLIAIYVLLSIPEVVKITSAVLQASFGDNYARVIDRLHSNGSMVKYWTGQWYWKTEFLTGDKWHQRPGDAGIRFTQNKWHAEQAITPELLSPSLQQAAPRQGLAISHVDQLQCNNCRWMTPCIVTLFKSGCTQGLPFHFLHFHRAKWGSHCGPCHPIDPPL